MDVSRRVEIRLDVWMNVGFSRYRKIIGIRTDEDTKSRDTSSQDGVYKTDGVFQDGRIFSPLPALPCGLPSVDDSVDSAAQSIAVLVQHA
jgi:hypothetical protein